MVRILLVILASLTSCAPAGEVAGAVPPLSDAPIADTIPPRPTGAASGTDFGRRTAGLPGPERQRLAMAEIVAGNVPEFLRNLVPVRLTAELADGPAEATVWVMPDYLAIGSDDDFLRMPLTYPSATAAVDRLGFVLPTCKIVDAVFEQARHRLPPEPLPPGPKMRSIEYYLKHRQLIERDRGGLPLGDLIAGHKKDVVLTQRLILKRDRIAIYGWHRPNGEAIQPLSTIHGAHYADYSHGIRPVWATVLVNGEERSIYDVLADPALAPLVSDEGGIPTAWQLMHPNERKRSVQALP